jgi:hypothetical protein
VRISPRVVDQRRLSGTSDLRQGFPAPAADRNWLILNMRFESENVDCCNRIIRRPDVRPGPGKPDIPGGRGHAVKVLICNIHVRIMLVWMEPCRRDRE